jgi:hypothetical protein
MGLIIGIFKKNGNVFTNAYARIGEIAFNNKTKIATFNIKVFSNKTDANLITTVSGLFKKIISGNDMAAQCYTQVNNEIARLKAQIATYQSEADLIVEGDTMRLIIESKIDSLTKRDILQLDGAVSDEVNV